jgi:glycosyltransferase involved in cell wall biosynthesis
MHVLVDGKIYGFQQNGGIGTYFYEILRRISQRQDVTVEMLVPRPCLGSPPGKPVRWTHSTWLPVYENPQGVVAKLLGRVFNRANKVILDCKARLRRNCVFHSTYFTQIDRKIPQVATVHDMNHELFPEKFGDSWGLAFRARLRENLCAATRVIAVSEKTKMDLLRFYPIDPAVVDVIHHAVDPHVFWPDRNPEHLARFQAEFGLTTPFLLYVGGRAHHYKNFDRTLKAFAMVTRSTPFTLAVAGRPLSPEEQQMVAELGIESRVRPIHNPPVEVLRGLYSHASAFVYPSLHEGFGLTLLEALACACPVLGSDIDIFHEVAGQAFLPFDPRDPASMAAAFTESMDENARQGLIRRGTERVREFSWDRCAEQTCEVYRKALKG